LIRGPSPPDTDSMPSTEAISLGLTLQVGDDARYGHPGMAVAARIDLLRRAWRGPALSA
jgi:hypothetical protein